MDEFFWRASPFDDDDDDFSFDEGHAELASEIREYADDDDDEFEEDERVGLNPPIRPLPAAPPPTKVAPAKKAPAKKAAKKK
jgi:hypothetical protein